MGEECARAHDTDPALQAREIVSSRVFPVSPKVLFAAFERPEHLARWWGPDGFTNTFEVFDPRPGGEWRFVMHGPDGRDYPNYSVFLDVAAPECVVFEHRCAPEFRMALLFDPQSDGTRLSFRMLFATQAMRDGLAGIVVPSNEQNFDRLAAELPRVVAALNAAG